MTKQNIIDIVSDATGLTKVETEAVMNGVMKTIIDSLAENERVELRGFGTFGVKHRMPKKARNPGTGDAIYLPERYVPTFKPSKIMRSRVNELTKKKKYDHIVCIGDDITDENMFKNLNKNSTTIKVGIKNTNANFYIDSPKSVINLLNDITTCLK